MTDFDFDYRPSNAEEGFDLLNKMPRGHYYALGEAGRAKYMAGSNYHEAMELVADEPTDQELFDLVHGPSMTLEEIANIHVAANADQLEIILEGHRFVVDADDISEAQDLQEGFHEIYFGEVLTLDAGDIGADSAVNDNVYEAILTDGRSVKIQPIAA